MGIENCVSYHLLHRCMQCICMREHLSFCVCFCMCLPFSLLLSRILLPSLVFYDISITCMSRHFESHRSHSLPALLLLQLYCKMQIEVQQMHQQNPHKRTHARTNTYLNIVNKTRPLFSTFPTGPKWKWLCARNA